MKLLFSLIAPLLATQVLAAPGVMIKDEDLRASAASGAANLGRIVKGEAVEILGRHGGWTEVSGSAGRGWVRILSVRSTASSAAGSGLSGLLQAGSTRGDSSRVVATAGLRGLDEEQLKSAHYDAGELMMMDRYLVSRATAEQYAQAAGLKHRDLDYLPAPQSAQEKSKPLGAGSLL